MQQRPLEDEVIVPGDMLKCCRCGEEGIMFLRIKKSGIIMGGSVCEHQDRSRIGKEISREKALNILHRELEAQETENGDGLTIPVSEDYKKTIRDAIFFLTGRRISEGTMEKFI